MNRGDQMNVEIYYHADMIVFPSFFIHFSTSVSQREDLIAKRNLAEVTYFTAPFAVHQFLHFYDFSITYFIVRTNKENKMLNT